jgi:hypothetical protein
MMKKFHLHLSSLYKKYLTFKAEFTAILNWPLMPTEFENAWRNLLDKYNLHDDPMMLQLWEIREEWISAYFKNVFCARMTSTQHSESMNASLKRGLLNEKLSLNRFAEQVTKLIFQRRQAENLKTYATQVLDLKTFTPHVVLRVSILVYLFFI